MKSVHESEYRVALSVLVKARKRARLTQQELSARLAKPQSFVSKYEHGKRRLDIVEFLHIIYTLEADPHKALKEIIATAPQIKVRVRKHWIKR